jgi:HSP20 family protein
VVKVELAGVSVEDVQIDVQGNVLYIAGSRRDRSCGYGGAYHQMEITYSSFEKTLKFPTSIEGVKLEHVFDNGLLIIRLRTGEAVKS